MRSAIASAGARGRRRRACGRTRTCGADPRNPPRRTTGQWGPADDRRAEQAARVCYGGPPSLAARAYLILRRRMPPAGIARREALVEVGGLRVRLRLAGSAGGDVAQQGHPAAGPSRRGPWPPAAGSTQCQDDAATRTSKRRPRSSQSSNVDDSTRVAEGREALAGQRRQAVAGLDSGHLAPERMPATASPGRCRSPPRAPATAGPGRLSQRGPRKARPGSRPRPVVELGDLVEHAPDRRYPLLSRNHPFMPPSCGPAPCDGPSLRRLRAQHWDRRGSSPVIFSLAQQAGDLQGSGYAELRFDAPMVRSPVPETTGKSTLALWPPRCPPILPGILLSSRISWGNRGGRRSPRSGVTCARRGTSASRDLLSLAFEAAAGGDPDAAGRHVAAAAAGAGRPPPPPASRSRSPAPPP